MQILGSSLQVTTDNQLIHKAASKYLYSVCIQEKFIRETSLRKGLVLIVSGRGWNYVGVAIVMVNCTVKHAVKHKKK